MVAFPLGNTETISRSRSFGAQITQEHERAALQGELIATSDDWLLILFAMFQLQDTDTRVTVSMV